MKDKIVLITGATSGIGKETAVGLAKLGATIVFTTREIDQGRMTRDEIIRESKNDKVDFIHCDLASFDSIRSCCEDFKSKYERLDVLINNAGVARALTNLLLDVLKRSAPSRIITVASTLHTRAHINFDDIEFKKSFSAWKAYSQSKLAVILFTKLLAEKLKDTGVTINCLHPGVAATNISRDANFVYRAFFKLYGKDPKKGAETSIYLASSPDIEKITGEYFVNKKIKQSSSESHDMEIAKKLWDLSVGYVHLDS